MEGIKGKLHMLVLPNMKVSSQNLVHQVLQISSILSWNPSLPTQVSLNQILPENIFKNFP